MRKNKAARVLMIICFVIVAFFVFGYVTMLLWNWLMPALFGLHTIVFWQAIGLLVLSKLLFGGFHGRHTGHGRWRHRMMQRWGRMTPEEREKFRELIRERWGDCEPEATSPKA
jgi:hypothetical protein